MQFFRATPMLFQVDHCAILVWARLDEDKTSDNTCFPLTWQSLEGCNALTATVYNMIVKPLGSYERGNGVIKSLK